MDGDRLLLVHAATLAPSSHNTQPWRFRIGSSTIDLLADPSRALPVNDPDDRELTLSCGCALMNLRVAASLRDLRAVVEPFPDPDRLDGLARVRFLGRHAVVEGGGHGPEPTVVEGERSPAPDADLAPFIETRRTHRGAFRDRDVEEAVVSALRAAARAEGAWLHVVADAEPKRRLARLVAGGDAAQWADPRWRGELAAWMRPSRDGEGLTVRGPAGLTRFVIRTFDLGRRIGARDAGLALDSPLLAVLGTEGDERDHWLSGGQALQRVLLEARRRGLHASFLNQPIQVRALRPRLEEAIGRSSAQIVLRLGYAASDLPATPRREVGSVLVAPDAPPLDPEG